MVLHGGSPRPGPDSLWYWPLAPDTADFFDGEGGVGGPGPPGWDVFSAPPEPFPYIDPTQIDLAVFGPRGTNYEYNLGDLGGRNIPPGLPSAAVKLAARYASSLFRHGIPTLGTGLWTVPGPIPGRHYVAAQVYRVGVHGVIAGGEEVINTFTLAAPPSGIVATGPGCEVVGDAVGTAWAAFISDEFGGGGSPSRPKDCFAGVTWDEVTCAVVTYPGVPRIGDIGKPTYDVLTVHRPMPGGVVSTGTSPLPTEVACVLSLGTSFRAKSGRGRTFLGPLDNAMMAGGAGGIFREDIVTHLAASFWNKFIQDAALRALGIPSVLSLKHNKVDVAITRPITGVRVGVVPDSMRSRRNKLSEGYVLAGGVAAGI